MPFGADPSSNVVPTWLNVAKIGDEGQRGDISLDFHHTVTRFKERTVGTLAKSNPAVNSESRKSVPTSTKRFAGR